MKCVWCGWEAPSREAARDHECDEETTVDESPVTEVDDE